MSEKKKWFEKISIFQKFKNIKNIEIIIAVIFAVIVFLIYFSSTNKGGLLTQTQNNAQTNFEQRLCSILSDIDGAGNVSVFVHSEDDDIVGIIIISSGADDVGVRLNILRAIQTVLKAPANNIEILVGNK